VQLAYSADFVPVDRRVCMSSERQTVGEVLTSMLRGTSLQLLVVAGRSSCSPGEAHPLSTPDSGPHGMSVLERVVVTGSAVAAPRRPLAIGVEVIDGEQMRRQALGSMAELLDATVRACGRGHNRRAR